MKLTPNKIFYLIFALFLAFIFITFRDYGMSWDENFHLTEGKTTFDSYSDPSKVSDYTQNINAVPQGVLTEMVYYLPLKIFSQENNYELLHLVKGLFGSLTLIFVYLSLRELGKKGWAQVLAPVLLIFSPRWLGDLFDNHTDIAAALLYSAEMFLAVKFIKKAFEKRGWIIVSFFAVISAISYAQRIVLIIIPFFTILSLIISKLKTSPNRETVFNIIKILLIFSPIFIATLFVVDPFTDAAGITGVFLKIKLSLAPAVGPNFKLLFEGKLVSADYLPRDYLPKFMAITTPLITLILLIAGTTTLLWKIFKDSNNTDRIAYIVFLSSLFLPIITSVALNPEDYDAWRHFLFLAVPMVTIASLGFEEILNKLSNIRFKWLVVAVVVINVGLVAREYVMLHPYEYVYFNSLVGGLKGATGRYETDYWAKSMKDAMSWLESNLAIDQSRQYKVAVDQCANPFQMEYYFSSNLVRVDDPKDADYYICPRVIYDKLPNKQPIHTIDREGVPINFIKEGGGS